MDDLGPRLVAHAAWVASAGAEGTRLVARDADLPVVLGYVDSATHTAGLGPSITISGDVTADMDRIRDFYADKHGIRPQNFALPRLREES